MRRRFNAGLISVAALVQAFSAMPAVAQTIRDLQERYCTGDAFRLCSSEIPNEDRITICMARQRHLLSPDCRAVFDDPASDARAMPGASVKPRKPMELVPE